MTKNYLIVGNWKMHTDIGEAEDLVTGLAGAIDPDGVEVVICPPVVFLEQCSLLVQEKAANKMSVGTQNISWEKEGAITGDIGINMVKDWARYVIVGHSERRKYFAETNNQIAQKLRLVIGARLTPVLCVGEKRFMTGDVAEVGKEMMEGIKEMSPEAMKKLVIAYEPVWAIGTGQAASPEYANKVIGELRSWLKDEYSFDVAERVRFLYGGSVDGKNALSYLKQEQIDGLLIGTASTKIRVFSKIIKDAGKLSKKE